MRKLIFVKLGGSLITDKRRPETARRKTLERLAGEIADLGVRRRAGLVLGHGGGSFGHAAAARFGLNRGKLSAAQLPGVSVTQDRAAALHRMVIAALERAGLPGFSLAPSSFLVASAGRPVSAQVEPLLLALRGGLLPVVYGDVVMDREWGASICSTESAFLALARRLLRRGYSIRRILWLGETEGIHDAGGSTLPRIRAGEVGRVLRQVGGARGADVTGGMAHRLRTAGALARLGIPSWILDGRVRGRLTDALGGRRVPGTRVEPEQATPEARAGRGQERRR